MYSQQHTIPITGEGEGDDLSSGAPWTTQPVTSQTRLGGFIRKLSQRSSSMKPVSSVSTCSLVEEEEEGAGKSWGSCTNLTGSVKNTYAPPSSMPRSPSLPSLHPNKLNEVDKLSGKSSVAETPQPHFQNKNVGTPSQNNLNFSRIGITPLNHSKLEQTPQHKNIFSSAHFESQSKLNSTTKIGLHNDMFSSVKQVSTPQHGSQNNKLFSRAPLKPITPRQQPLTTGYFVSSIKEETHLKETLIIEKENQFEQKLIKTSPTPQTKRVPAPAWKQDLLRQMLQDSPELQISSASAKKSSPETQPPSQQFRRTLFESTPAKVEHKSQVVQEQVQLKLEAQTKHEYTHFEGPAVPHHQTSQPELKQAESVHLATPVPPRQPEHAFKPPPRPAEPPSATEPVRVAEHKFKPPPTRAEPTSQEVIVVNGVTYVVGHRLGRGGSSEVFQVTRQGDNTVLAIKCVNLRAVDDVIRAGYLNEITLLQRMQGNSRVVQLIDYELCESRQVLFVVMEKGARDLAAFLKDRARRRDLRIGTVEAFWQDMVEAVAAIHERGIIHSDLKPANFLLVGEVGFHQLKLIDFGIASSLQSDMTSVVRETPAGTLNYMSPEAVRGMQGQQCPVKINYKSDIWSLGCILYNLLYGRTPFQHIPHPALKAEAICNPRNAVEFPAKSPILPGDGTVPPALLHTVRSCLNRDPVDRPSATQLLAVKYCGCEENPGVAMIDALVQGLASLIHGHPMGREISTRLVTALQEGESAVNSRRAS